MIARTARGWAGPVVWEDVGTRSLRLLVSGGGCEAVAAAALSQVSTARGPVPYAALGGPAVRGTGRNSQGAISGRSVMAMAMDNRSEVREFLASRRAKITPEQVGLPTFGGSRRVKGLRRGEV